MRSASRPLAFGFTMRSWLILAVLVLSCAPRPSSEHAKPGRSPVVQRDDFRTVLARRTPELMAIEGVSGTGEGMDAGDTVLVVFVTRRTAEIEARVPREIDGWRTVLREVGQVTAPPR